MFPRALSGEQSAQPWPQDLAFFVLKARRVRTAVRQCQLWIRSQEHRYWRPTICPGRRLTAKVRNRGGRKLILHRVDDGKGQLHQIDVSYDPELSDIRTWLPRVHIGRRRPCPHKLLPGAHMPAGRRQLQGDGALVAGTVALSPCA